MPGDGAERSSTIGADIAFDGDVAIVTGAGRGIGRAHALELARRGARVVVNDVGEGVADEVVGEIRAAGGEAVSNSDGVDTAAGGEAVVATAVEAFGRVDILVNNAGILRDAMFHKMDADQWDAVLAVHLTGTRNVTVPAWRHMREQKYGRIVNTTSATGLFGNVGQANYGAAKAGLYGLTRNLAVEGRKAGILVNAVSPMAATRMNADLLGEKADLLDPGLIAPVVAYLASRELTRTGQVLSTGGGHVSAVLLTVTRGITDPALTAETVRDRLDEVFAPEDAIVPRHIGDEMGMVVEAIEQSRVGVG
jgi:NAD(P)-dependent dehydrogenase (short-subunit alcohol dehydrogenase family)